MGKEGLEGEQMLEAREWGKCKGGLCLMRNSLEGSLLGAWSLALLQCLLCILQYPKDHPSRVKYDPQENGMAL